MGCCGPPKLPAREADAPRRQFRHYRPPPPPSGGGGGLPLPPKFDVPSGSALAARAVHRKRVLSHRRSRAAGPAARQSREVLGPGPPGSRLAAAGPAAAVRPPWAALPAPSLPPDPGQQDDELPIRPQDPERHARHLRFRAGRDVAAASGLRRLRRPNDAAAVAPLPDPPAADPGAAEGAPPPVRAAPSRGVPVPRHRAQRAGSRGLILIFD